MRSTDAMKLIIIFTLLVVVPPEILTDKVGCKDVACPTPEPCPSDSFPKLIVKHHSTVHTSHQQRSSTGEIVRRERAIAYSGRQRESIKIIPGAYDHHRKRSITDDEMLIQYCCPRYECACKPNYCDHECPPNKIPVNTTGPTDLNDLPYGVPGNCCVPCKNNYCIHHTFRKHGEKWRSDDCTTCECHYGEVKCQQSYCNPPDCLSYKQIPGECCPVCDNDSSNFCHKDLNCNIHCKYGYRRKGNCDLCECTVNLQNQTTIGSSYPETTTLREDHEISENTENKSQSGGPHQEHTHSHLYSRKFWSYVSSSIIVLSAIIMLTVWRCRSRKSAKYSTVQIA